MFQYVELLEEYVRDNYNLDNNLIKIKLSHTVRVYKLMIELVERLNLENHDKVLALFIALFHDIGRFYEIRKNNKMNNRYDHANDSVTILFDEGLIKKFPIDPEDYDLIRKAVYYHNKKEIPNDLTNREKAFCHMIRDVDKIDIIHVLASEFQREFNFIPTEKILFDFYNKDLIDINDIHNPSDTIVLYLSFQDQLIYKESHEILYEKKYLEEFINSIKVLDNTLIKDTFDHLVDEAINHRDDYLYHEKILRKR